jgi:hypothetical protein
VTEPDGRSRRQREHINVEEGQHELYRKWADSTRKDEQLFVNMPAMFVFCAALGQASSKRRVMSGRKVDVFRWNQFSEQLDVPIVEAICVAESGGFEVLEDRSILLDLAEECATGGADLLRQELTGSRERNLEALAKLAIDFGVRERTPSKKVTITVEG